MSSSPHAIIVRVGASKHLKGREIVEMAQRLKQKGYSQPGMYARKLYREGIRLDGKWIDESGPEGHLQGGGLGHTGRRYVSGVKERLYGSRGGPGSLEKTHGFRDASRRPRSSRDKRYSIYERGREHLHGGGVVSWTPEKHGPGVVWRLRRGGSIIAEGTARTGDDAVERAKYKNAIAWSKEQRETKLLRAPSRDHKKKRHSRSRR